MVTRKAWAPSTTAYPAQARDLFGAHRTTPDLSRRAGLLRQFRRMPLTVQRAHTPSSARRIWTCSTSQDRDVPAAALGEGVLAPGPPMHRILGVLLQVRAHRALQAVHLQSAPAGDSARNVRLLIHQSDT